MLLMAKQQRTGCSPLRCVEVYGRLGSECRLLAAAAASAYIAGQGALTQALLTNCDGAASRGSHCNGIEKREKRE